MKPEIWDEQPSDPDVKIDPRGDDVRTVREVTIGAVKEVKGVELTPELESTRLDEHDIDSLDLIEVGMIIEAEFGVQLDPEDFEGLDTVQDLLVALDDKVKSSRR